MNDKELERELIEQSREFYQQKTLPGLYFSENMGNMYTPSLYYSLFSFLSRSKFALSISLSNLETLSLVSRTKNSYTINVSFSSPTVQV